MRGNAKHLVKGCVVGVAGLALAVSAGGVAGAVENTPSHHPTTTRPKTTTPQSTVPPIKAGSFPAVANPCSYVSARQVSQIVGQKVRASQTSALFQSNLTQCVYKLGNASRRRLPATISLTYYSPAQLAHINQTASSYLASQTRHLLGVQTVPNLGQKAYSFNNGTAYFVMTRGGVIYVISSSFAPNAQAAAQQVATLATKKVQSSK
jgi:hypothetical protein